MPIFNEEQKLGNPTKMVVHKIGFRVWKPRIRLWGMLIIAAHSDKVWGSACPNQASYFQNTLI